MNVRKTALSPLSAAAEAGRQTHRAVRWTAISTLDPCRRARPRPGSTAPVYAATERRGTLERLRIDCAMPPASMRSVRPRRMDRGRSCGTGLYQLMYLDRIPAAAPPSQRDACAPRASWSPRVSAAVRQRRPARLPPPRAATPLPGPTAAAAAGGGDRLACADRPPP